MKLIDVYSSTLQESMDNPFPYRKVSNTRYVIDLPNNENILVVLYQKQIEQYNCLSVLFVNPNSPNPTALTNFFNSPEALRVFASIIEILESIKSDLIFFTPDDIEVEVENRKLRVYQTILKKMERLGKILSSEVVNIEEFDKPILIGIRVGSNASSINNKTLIEIAKLLGISKMRIGIN